MCNYCSKYTYWYLHNYSKCYYYAQKESGIYFNCLNGDIQIFDPALESLDVNHKVRIQYIFHS